MATKGEAAAAAAVYPWFSAAAAADAASAIMAGISIPPGPMEPPALLLQAPPPGPPPGPGPSLGVSPPPTGPASSLGPGPSLLAFVDLLPGAPSQSCVPAAALPGGSLVPGDVVAAPGV